MVCFVQLTNKYNDYFEEQLLSDNHNYRFKPISVFNMSLKVDTSPSLGDWERNKVSVDIPHKFKRTGIL